MIKKISRYPLLIISSLLILAVVPTWYAVAGTAVTWNGTSYTIPSVGEENWFGADKVDGFLIALGTHSLQKSGGMFTLTSELDFGATAGVIGSYFGTRSSNDSTAGVFRLSNAESIGWRNAAASGNLLLTVNSANDLQYNGISLMSSSGLVPVSSGGTGLASYAVGDMIYATPNSQTLTKLPVGSTGQILRVAGGVPTWSAASTTADHVVINSGAGALSSEATLAVSRGGTNIASYTTGDLLYASGASTVAKLGIGSAGQALKVSGGLPAWASAAASAAVTTKSSDYTATSSDDLIMVSPTVGTLVISLPAASANTGKVYYFKRNGQNSFLGKVSPASGDILDNGSLGAALILGSKNDAATIVSDGTTHWRVLSDSVKVALTVSGDAASAGTGAPIILPTVSTDTHGGYSVSTGRYTVPVSGHYVVSGYMIDGSDIDYAVYVNAASVAIVGASSTPGKATISGVIKVEAGDLVDIRPNGTADVSVASTMSITRIK